jgi:hypothetical protein
MQHMVAGAIAGMGEHLAMFPVDTVKTRMQALAHPGQQASSLFLCSAKFERAPRLTCTNSYFESDTVLICSCIPPWREQCRQF